MNLLEFWRRPTIVHSFDFVGEPGGVLAPNKLKGADAVTKKIRHLLMNQKQANLRETDSSILRIKPFNTRNELPQVI